MPVKRAGDAGQAWYACYTRSRHEKRVAAGLERRSIPSFLPVVPRESRWHDRTRTIEWPMFPGYVFGRFSAVELSRVLGLHGVVTVVSSRGRPLAVAEAEIENVRRFARALAETGQLPEAAPLFEQGEPVRAVRGPFEGVRGLVVETRGRGRVLIQVGLEAVQRGLRVELEARDLERLDASPAATPGEAYTHGGSSQLRE